MKSLWAYVILGYGVIGNTFGFGPEEWGFEALYPIYYMVIVAERPNALDCGSSIRKDFVGSNPTAATNTMHIAYISLMY